LTEKYLDKPAKAKVEKSSISSDSLEAIKLAFLSPREPNSG
jgi:hypothetical protein